MRKLKVINTKFLSKQIKMKEPLQKRNKHLAQQIKLQIINKIKNQQEVLLTGLKGVKSYKIILYKKHKKYIRKKRRYRILS